MNIDNKVDDKVEQAIDEWAWVPVEVDWVVDVPELQNGGGDLGALERFGSALGSGEGTGQEVPLLSEGHR